MPLGTPEAVTFPRTRQGVRDLDQAPGNYLPFSGGPAWGGTAAVNVGSMERFLSTVGGTALMLFGLSRGKALGLGLAMAGGAFVYRGLAGHCHVYEALGVNTRTGQGTASGAEVAYRLR